ncbi:MAG TPA: hypothetical protein VI248_10030 [Kineosporiaceae bacterium]
MTTPGLLDPRGGAGPTWRSTSPGGGTAGVGRVTSTSPRHVPSHLELLSAPVDAAAAEPGDAAAAAPLTVVPTCRPVRPEGPGIGTAIDLARAGHVHRLLFLVSKDAATPQSVAALQELVARGLPGEVPTMILALRSAPRVRAVFDVDRLPLTSAFRRYARGRAAIAPGVNEVGIKRNVALLIARSLELDRILFLDDDIRPMPPGCPSTGTLDGARLAAASAELDRGRSVVGWILRGYDDNSVVCRAARLAGVEQRQFIGGGALLAGVGAETPFFPAIYNEDWLFLLGMLDPNRPPSQVFGCAGEVLQDPYDGYAPRRARAEELGDILGEGLMGLLHGPANAITEIPGHRFWREVVDDRRLMITDLRRRLAARSTQDPQVGRAGQALDAALAVHAAIGARRSFWIDQFVRYVAGWQTDLEEWARQMTKVVGTPVDEVARGAVLASCDVFDIVDSTGPGAWRR